MIFVHTLLFETPTTKSFTLQLLPGPCLSVIKFVKLYLPNQSTQQLCIMFLLNMWFCYGRCVIDDDRTIDVCRRLVSTSHAFDRVLLLDNNSIRIQCEPPINWRDAKPIDTYVLKEPEWSPGVWVWIAPISQIYHWLNSICLHIQIANN